MGKDWIGVGIKKCAELLPNRNVGSIQSRATTLGVKRNIDSTYKKWTTEEEKLMNQHFNSDGYKYIMRVTGRSKSSVIKKAKQLTLI